MQSGCFLKFFPTINSGVIARKVIAFIVYYILYGFCRIMLVCGRKVGYFRVCLIAETTVQSAKTVFGGCSVRIVDSSFLTTTRGYMIMAIRAAGGFVIFDDVVIFFEITE